MKTPIDFGKEFLYKYFDQRDADSCKEMLAGDLVWITPENMHHFLSEGAVLRYLQKQVDAEKEPRYVDLISIKSSPSADNIMTVAYEINLVSREEERPLYLRCSMVICRRSKRLEITFLHFSKKSERDSSEQLRAFIANLPCGVMILACLDGRREEAIYYNEYFAHRLRYKEDEFARAMVQNPFFMTSEEDRERLHEEIEQARKNGGSITANLRFYRRDGNSFYYRMKGAPAYNANGGTVYYCVFQETTGFRMTADRLQERLDSATEILRQIPEAICGIEYPPHTMLKRADAPGADPADADTAKKADEHAAAGAAASVSEGGSSEGGNTVVIAAQEAGDGDVKIYRGRRKGSRTAEKSAEKSAPVKTAALRISGSGPRVFFTSKNIPSMFGVSNSVYMKNILEDPFFGLEITSITRDRLLSSYIMNPDKTATGKAVSCGIFRVRRADKAEDKAIRVELMVRRVKDKDGTMRLYLFYYDREAAQQEMDNRVDRAMKMGRAGKEQLRADLRKAKETAVRKQGELIAAMKEAEKKHTEELTLVENNLVEEKKRTLLMSRQLEESKAAQKESSAERDRIEEESERRIRNHEARAQRQIKEACSARDLLEEQLREAQERNRALEQQLNKEKARRLTLEEQFRLLQEQNDELQKSHTESREPAPANVSETISAAMLGLGSSRTQSAAVIQSQAVRSSSSAQTSAGMSSAPVMQTSAAVSSVPAMQTSAAVSSAPVMQTSAAVSSKSVMPALSGGARDVDWMTQTETLTVFSSMDPAGEDISRKTETNPDPDSDPDFLSDPYSGLDALFDSKTGPEPEKKKVFRQRDFTQDDQEEIQEEYPPETSSGESVLRPEAFSPETFIHDIMVYEDIACEEKNITLRLLRDSRLPSRVIGFASLLRGALCEIVENAISRTRPGGTISVHCRADRPSGGLINLYFRIDDKGSVIPEEEMQMMFETEKINFPGASARPGLYAAQEAAALMGGSLNARSTPELTRFSLTVALRV